MVRHKVRAGMTGRAQCTAGAATPRCPCVPSTTFYYIENWSLLLDVKIVCMTVLHGPRQENGPMRGRLHSLTPLWRAAGCGVND
jgi:putative colanic acid biosynthesis UDP-glucose lipid carrier transferase